MFGGNYFTQNGTGNLPLFNNWDQDSSKLSHDSYNVYVNRDFVGNKTLLTPNEKVSDIDDYLKKQGVNNFSSSVYGCDYIIDSGVDEARRIKTVLNVYLNIR